MMTDKIIDAVRRFSMIPSGSKVLCALSGGADSTALLYALIGVSEQLEIAEIVAAHLNHQLRGEESDRDAEFVSGLAANAGVRLYTGRSDIAAEAKMRGMGIEETARAVRYEFFRMVCEQSGCTRVATGHTANDSAETIIMNLTRGSGLSGVTGIPPVRDRIIRPIIYVTRDECLEFLDRIGVGYVVDSTNDDTAFTRNHIRHKVMPELTKINRAAMANLLSFAELARGDYDYISSQVGISLLSTRRVREGIAVDAGYFSGLHDSISSRLCRTLCEIVSDAACEISRGHVDSIAALAESDSPSARIDLPHGVVVRRIYTDLVFCRPSSTPLGFDPVDISDGVDLTLPEIGAMVSCRNADSGERDIVDNLFNIFYVKRDMIECGLSVRPRVQGDSIRLAGRGVTKSLKKLFIENKIPAHLRPMTPVLADGDRVVAVPGLGIDEDYASAPGEPVIRVEFQFLEDTL